MVVFKVTIKIPALVTNSIPAVQLNEHDTYPQQCSIFYELYQIDAHLPDDETERRSGRGLKSLWGSLWSVCSTTGWSLEEVLWKISWINLQMMIVDAPRYNDEKDDLIPEPESLEELDKLMQKFKQ